jgi:tRNA(Ile)-lysidine synthase TilS/MesJ
VQICKKCVLPASFPGVSFDEEGICNHCREYERSKQRAHEQKRRHREKFERLWSERRRDGGYDCLVCYSGGKDSTYTLDVLMKEYGAAPLAVTVDNGFVAPRALENIRLVVERLGVDHFFIKPRFDTLRKIFAACARDAIFPPKTLERASTICTACMAIVKFISLQVAVEKKIPFIVYGWSPGQAPVASSVFRHNASMVRKMQEALRAPLERIAGAKIIPFFLQERHFQPEQDFPYNINPLAFLEYDEAIIHERIARLGWQKPDDTDPNSTNCLLNAYANKIHMEQFGYNPYTFELAHLVREGVLERKEALNRLSESDVDQVVVMVKKRLTSS